MSIPRRRKVRRRARTRTAVLLSSSSSTEKKTENIINNNKLSKIKNSIYFIYFYNINMFSLSLCLYLSK